MRREVAVDLLDRLHTAQNEFYAGRAPDFRSSLTADVTWYVPGNSPIAGVYRGIDEVLGYFRYRRQLAAFTFRLIRRDVLVGMGDQIAALTDGTAHIYGAHQTWSTVGLYELDGARVSHCWLLPLDLNLFDAIWGYVPPETLTSK